MIETLVGLNVIDRDGYAQYRAHMTPILEAHGGHFGIDLWVAELLRSHDPQPFNRLFSLVFPSVEQRDRFFANAEYQKIRETFLYPSISGRVQLGRLEP